MSSQILRDRFSRRAQKTQKTARKNQKKRNSTKSMMTWTEPDFRQQIARFGEAFLPVDDPIATWREA
jgi:hypothetical protein